MSEPRRTPLHDLHVAAGARMVEFAGWRMPVQYSSIVDEHLTVRSKAGLFDVSHMGEVLLTGPGAESCCARLFANDARRLRVGRAQYSLICNDGGGVIDDIIVYRLEPETFLVCLNASNAQRDIAWIRERADGECAIEDACDRYGLLALQGPAAVEVVAALAADAAAVTSLGRFGCARTQVAGIEVIVARTGYTGEDGFEMFVDADAAAELWSAILTQGAAHGVVPVGLGARDTLRLEAALPLYGHELNEDTSPYEAGLDWVVKLDRPEMIGFAALQDARDGGARRQLIGLEVSSGIARDGCEVLASGTSIGKVTSGSYSPCRESGVALAMVGREALMGGGEDAPELAVEIRGKCKAAKRIELPFYERIRDGVSR